MISSNLPMHARDATNRTSLSAASRRAALAAAAQRGVEALEPRRLLSAGQLDPTFGQGGVVVDQTHPGAAAVVVQSDGKIITAGAADYGSGTLLSLNRRNPDGSLDTRFGYRGGVVEPLGTQGAVQAMALQPDGKILVAASSIGANGNDFIFRFLPNGQLDSGFGSGGEVIVASPQTELVIGVVPEANGKIVVGLWGGGLLPVELDLVRLNADGSLDPTFGAGGKVAKLESQSYIATGMAVEPNGSIAVAGNVRLTQSALIERFTSAGAFDGTVFATPPLTRSIPGPDAIVAQPDGKLIVAGQLLFDGTVSIIRYNVDGTIDPSFVAQGVDTTQTGYQALLGSQSQLRLQTDGKILVYGTFQISDTGMVQRLLYRLNSDGSTDSTFGLSGRGQIPFPGLIAISPNGSIVIAGGSTPYELDLARLTGDFNTPPAESPFGNTPIALPNTIEAENFDNGGEGVAYHSSSSINAGGEYRNTGVSIQSTGDAGGGFNVGWTHAGDYLKYAVTVGTPGTYLLSARVANVASGGAFHVEVDGVNVSGTLAVPDTGGWQSYVTVNGPGVTLAAGNHVVTLVMERNSVGGFTGNFNWLRFAGTTGVISGNVFNDLNGDSLDNPAAGETGVAGEMLYLDVQGLEHFAPGDPTALTEAGGNFTFSNLPPGNYLVGINPGPGEVINVPLYRGKYYVHVDAGQTVGGLVFGTQKIYINAMRQPDGKLLVGGSRNAIIATLKRYNADLSVDTGFGTLGVVDLGTTNIFVTSTRPILLRPDGGILVAWSTNTGFTSIQDLSLVSSSGALLGTTELSRNIEGQGTFVNSLALLANNKVALTTIDRAGGLYFHLFNPDLSPDATFGFNGVLPLGTGYDQIPGIVVLANGRIVQTTGAAPVLLNQNGIADTTIPFAAQADGKFLVGGEHGEAITRYNSNGSVDTAFGVNGSAKSAFPFWTQQVLVLANGAIVVQEIQQIDGAPTNIILEYFTGGGISRASQIIGSSNADPTGSVVDTITGLSPLAGSGVQVQGIETRTVYGPPSTVTTMPILATYFVGLANA